MRFRPVTAVLALAILAPPVAAAPPVRSEALSPAESARRDAVERFLRARLFAAEGEFQEALKEFRLVDQLMLLSKHQDIQIQVSKKVLGGKLELLGSGTFSGAQSQGSVGAKLYLRERLFLEFATTPGNEQNPMSGRLGWQVPLE